MFEKIKMFYDKGLWTAEMVYQAIVKGVLTADEYAAIVDLKRDKEADSA